MIAVNSGIPSSQVSSPGNLEMMVVSVHFYHPVTICAVYIPLNSDSQYHHSLYSYLSLIGSYKNLIILGDFNASDIDWLTLHSTTHSSGMLCDFIFDCNLSKLIQEPTHSQGNLLDLVITDYKDGISNLVVHPHTDYIVNFDHFIITFEVLKLIHHYPKLQQQATLNYRLEQHEYIYQHVYL